MSSDIKPGDVVVGVAGRFSTCPIHNERVLGPDPCPEMAGRAFLVCFVGKSPIPKCSGLIGIQGDRRGFCIGCFRKLNDSEDDAELIARIKSYQPETVPA